MKKAIIASVVIAVLGLGAVTPAQANPVWEFLKIIFTPTPTGGCDSDGKNCTDML